MPTHPALKRKSVSIFRINTTSSVASVALLLLTFSSLAFAKQKVISLAPHLTEMMFSAGAGDQLIGAVESSDYPEASTRIPRVGGYSALNYEKIVSLKPDVVLVWDGGNSHQEISRLEKLDITIIRFTSKRLQDIPQTIRQLGKLFDTEPQANQVAKQLEQQLEKQTLNYQHRPKISVFYQIWDKPLITVGKHQFISEAIELCGGKNIFDDQKQPAPQVSSEAVLSRNPQLILLGGQSNKQAAWQSYWQNFSQLKASQQQHIYKLNADLYQRPTARLINALPELCQLIDRARQHH